MSQGLSNINALLVDPPVKVHSQRPYPLNIQALMDIVNFDVTKAQGVAFGKIRAIRVQDIARQKWFNWDNGTWDETPSCLPGEGNLYIAVYAENLSQPGNLLLQLYEIVEGTGRILTDKSEYVAHGAGLGIEWTGNMPANTYNLLAKVIP